MECSFKQRASFARMESVWIALLDEKLLVDKTIKFSLTLSLGYRIGFLWGDLHPHGLSKSVYRSQSFHVQQYVGEGVELYKKIKKPPLFRLIHQQGIILSTFKPFSQARPGFHSLKSTVNLVLILRWRLYIWPQCHANLRQSIRPWKIIFLLYLFLC